MTQAFLIREATKKVLHGIFWARDLDDLWRAVDEMADPFYFEYKPCSRAGGIWHDIPLGVIPDTEDSEGERATAPLCVYSENLTEMMETDKGWKRFDDAATGHGVIAQIMRKRLDGNA